MFIEFGAQHGFKTDMRFRGCKNSLNQIFNSDKNKPCIHFKTLHEFSIIFRIAGGRITFGGGEGPERLRKGRNQPYYTIDLVIPKKTGLKKPKPNCANMSHKAFGTALPCCGTKRLKPAKLKMWQSWMPILNKAWRNFSPCLCRNCQNIERQAKQKQPAHKSGRRCRLQ